MATYRPLSNGLYELDSSAGPIPVSATEDQLQAYGHTLDPGALALNDNGTGGQGNVPANASDAVPNYSPAGQGGAPAQSLDQDLFDGAPNSPAMSPKNEAVGDVTKATNPITDGNGRPKTDKFAPKTEDVDLKKYLEGVRSSAGPSYVRIPQKDIKAQWTVRKGKSVPEDLLEADSDAAINQRLAMQKKSDLEADRADRMGEAADDAIGAQEKAISADEIKVQKWRQEYARRQAVIDKEREANDQLKIDPDKVFNDKGGTLAKLGAALQIIGGAGVQAGYRLAENPGMKAVNQIIDRNIELQREEIANRKASTRGKENELERLTKVYGSPELAEQELRNRQMSLFSAYAKRAMMQSPDDVRANFDAAMADFEKERVASRVAIDQAAQDDVTEQWVNRPASTVAVGGPGKEMNRVVSVDGTDLFARTPEQAKDVQEKITNSTMISNQLAELKALAQKAPSFRVGSAEWDATLARMKSIAYDVMPRMNVAVGQGAMSGDEAERNIKMVGDPEALIRTNQNEMLDETIRGQHTFKKGLIRDYLYRDKGATAHAINPEPAHVRE